MARRMSNRQRIARAAEEARLAASERRKPGEERMRVVWVVREPSGKPVQAFPYPQKDKAEAEAKRLKETKGGEYYVDRDKVPM